VKSASSQDSSWLYFVRRHRHCKRFFLNENGGESRREHSVVEETGTLKDKLRTEKVKGKIGEREK
ncbi:unnamed protein product, partial [Oikopleura dioica]